MMMSALDCTAGYTTAEHMALPAFALLAALLGLLADRKRGPGGGSSASPGGTVSPLQLSGALPQASWLLSMIDEGYAQFAPGRSFAGSGELVLQGWNSAWEALTGRLDTDAAGKRIEDLYGEEAQELSALVMRALSAPGPSEAELRFSGTGKWCRSRAFLLADGAVAVLLTDVTARYQMESLQRQASLGRLAAAVTHELNNLLSGLVMTADLTRYVQTQEAYEELVDTVRDLVPRGGDLCRRITTFSRPDEPRRVPLDLDEAVDAALSLAAHHTRDTGIAIQRDAGSRQNLVEGDRGQLEQVFLNLFLNACQAMPDGGILDVRSWRETAPDGSEQVVVTVSDTGTGIAPEHLPHVFSPYFTTKGEAQSTPVGGSGLGLAVSRDIVLRHQGSLEVDSELGTGTTFELRFSACTGECVQAGEVEEALLQALEAAPPGLRVLLVEDQPQFLHAVTRILRLAGFHTLSTDNAHQAWALLQAAEFDLVVTDVGMSAGGGRHVLAWARRVGSPPPVLAITGRGEEGLDEELQRLGACGVLRKPFDMTRLVEAITEAVAGK